MSRLQVPTAPIRGGASATPPPPVDDGVGRTVAEFGERMYAGGQALEQDRLTSELTRAHVAVANGIADLRLELEQETDPDHIDAAWEARSEELRARVSEGLDERNSDRFAASWASVTNPAKLELGRRAMELRRERALGDLAARADADALTLYMSAADREEAAGAYAGQVMSAVALGHLPADRAARIVNGYRAKLATGAMRRLQSTEPARLVELIDAGEFNDVPADTREQFRAAAYAAAETDAEAGFRADLTRGLSDSPSQLIADIDAGAYDDAPEDMRASYRAQAVAAEQAQVAASARANKTAQTEAETEADRDLAALIDVARTGRTHVDEARILADPVAKTRPGYQDALGVIQLRAAGVPQMTPAQMRAYLTGMKSRPSAGPEDAAAQAALEAAIPAAEAAWQSDPIAQARQTNVLPTPELPSDLSSPANWARALAGRRSAIASLQASGYTTSFAPFSAEELERLQGMAAVSASPEQRAQLAQILASSFRGDEAVKVFEAVAPKDRAFGHFGLLLAAGSRPATAMMGFRGASAIASGAVELPKKGDAARREAYGEEIGDALTLVPGHEDEILAGARAIYGELARGMDPESDEADAAWRRAVQLSLGRGAASARADAGGVQEVNGRKTLLPLDLTADDLNETIFDGPWGGGDTRRKAVFDALSALAGGAPSALSGPLTADDMDEISFAASASGLWRVQVRDVNGGWRDLVAQGSGAVIELDLHKLLSDVRGRLPVRP
ncbi:hypothetical protein P2H44_22665 [Albimonas sp. CAU 1670]|uniref:hypothetical protein n=1 Tax=Albimonas sp. CAU 1670 TaxID=3032599 RepID=UPI0023DABC29|nr:hypothetical protein [Albimonas sp. CAU 1670]MDF2235368.1 hypothetical protein [Albimonas sp. CAU 1670]